MAVRLIIFDLDGTLIDTIPDIGGAMNRVLQRHGMPVHPVEAYKEMVGNGLARAAELAVPPEIRGTADFRAIVDEFIAEYAEHPLDGTTVYPGIPEMLSAFTKLNIPTAICTNKRTPIAVHIVERLLSFHRFAGVIGEGEGKRKPDPWSTLYLIDAAGTDPESTLFLGDSEVDMKTALASGAIPCAALWGYRSGDILAKAGARELFSDPASFGEWVTERYR